MWIPLAVGAGAAVGGGIASYVGAKKAAEQKQQQLDDFMKNAPAVDMGAGQLGGWQQTGADLAGANPIDTSQQSQFRQGQLGLMGQLQQAAIGKGPSAAQDMLARAAEQNAAQARSASVSMAGVNPALAMRQSIMGQTQGNIASAREAAIIRAQEQQNAMGMLGNLTGQARGQDIGLAQAQADLVKQYMAMGLSASEAQAQANIALQQLQQQSYNQRGAIALGTDMPQPLTQLGGGLTGAGTGLMGAAAMGMQGSSGGGSSSSGLTSGSGSPPPYTGGYSEGGNNTDWARYGNTYWK